MNKAEVESIINQVDSLVDGALALIDKSEIVNSHEIESARDLLQLTQENITTAMDWLDDTPRKDPE